MLLKFIKDKKYDLQMVILFLRGRSLDEVELYSRFMGINFSLAKQIAKGKFEHKELENMVNNRYKQADKYLAEVIKVYQKSWNQINDKFFKLLIKKTRASPKHKRYYCVVSLFHRGISNWGGNKVVVGWRENQYVMRKVVAHEIVIAYLWNVLSKRYKNLDDTKKWAIGEVYAWCLLGLDKEMIKFWPWESPEQLFPRKHNYPQLYKLQDLGKRYHHKKEFGEFISRMIKHLITRKAG